jgi:hypothetical protein
MTAIINGSSPTVTFSDGTTQATSAIVSGYVPYANLPAGSVLQVVYSSYATEGSITSQSYADTGLTATITPKYSTSKILVIAQIASVGKGAANGSVYMRLLRGASVLLQLGAGWIAYNSASTTSGNSGVPMEYLDSPATTSATTYKVQYASELASQTSWVQGSNTASTMILMEIAG